MTHNSDLITIKQLETNYLEKEYSMIIYCTEVYLKDCFTSLTFLSYYLSRLLYKIFYNKCPSY